MTAHCSVLIVVSRERLDAYLVQPDGRAQIVKQTDFLHDGQTSVPLLDWAAGDAVSCGKVAQMIEGILGRYGHGGWALGCPESVGAQLMGHVSTEAQQALVSQRFAEVTDVDADNVIEWFTYEELP